MPSKLEKLQSKTASNLLKNKFKNRNYRWSLDDSAKLLDCLIDSGIKLTKKETDLFKHPETKIVLSPYNTSEYLILNDLFHGFDDETFNTFLKLKAGKILGNNDAIYYGNYQICKYISIGRIQFRFAGKFSEELKEKFKNYTLL